MNSEAFVIGWLNAHLTEPVSADIPATRPAEFVTVERTGGRATREMDYPTWAVQCWSTSRAKAAVLALKVSDLLLHDLPLESAVADISVTAMYNFPDPDSSHARYQLVVVGRLMTS